MSSNATTRRARGAMLAVAAATVGLAATGPAAAAVDPRWVPAIDVRPLGPSASQPTMAMGPGGDVAVVWAQGGGILAALKQPGSPVGGPLELTPGSTGGGPEVAVDGSGGTLATWHSGSVGARVVRAAWRPPGAAAFEPPVDLSSGEDATFPRVAIDAAGNAIVVWHETADGDPTYDVMSARRTADGGFSPAAPVAEDVPTPLQPSRVAIDGSGIATVVWQQGGDIRVATAPAAGTFALSQLNSGLQDTRPDVAVDAAGTALVAWEAQTGGSHGIYAALRDPGEAAFGTPEKLSGSHPTPLGARAAVGPDGAASVTWRAPTGTEFHSPALAGQAHRPPGGPWSGPSVLSAPDASTISTAVAAGPDGASFALHGTLSGDLFAERRLGGLLAPPLPRKLDADDSYVWTWISAGADDAGNAAFAWTFMLDDGRSGVRLAGIDAAPPIVDSLEVPSEAVAGVPVQLAAAARDVWSDTSVSWVVKRDGDDTATTFGGATREYAFPAPGRHEVTMTAADDEGRSTVLTRIVEVEPAPAPAPAPPPPARERPGLSLSVPARTVVAPRGAFPVRCALSAARLRSCEVRLRTLGNRSRVLGSGRVAPDRQGRAAVATLRLNRAGRVRVGRALGGVPARVVVRARTHAGETLNASARTRLLAQRQRVVTPPGSFGPDHSELRARGVTFLVALALRMRAVDTVRCRGYSATVLHADPRRARQLGLERARTVCGTLRRAGVRATLRLSSGGASGGAADDAGEASRARDRRVEVTLVRRR